MADMRPFKISSVFDSVLSARALETILRAILRVFSWMGDICKVATSSVAITLTLHRLCQLVSRTLFSVSICLSSDFTPAKWSICAASHASTPSSSSSSRASVTSSEMVSLTRELEADPSASTLSAAMALLVGR